MTSLATVQALYGSTDFAVFPLAGNTKVPIKGSRGFLDAKPAMDWSDWPNGANVGIATGMRSGGLVVIDLDGSVGVQNWTRLLQTLKCRIKTKTTYTPHGYHLYFTAPVPFGSNAGVLAKKIDVRAEGGYVVGAGSIVNRSPYTMNDLLPERLPPVIGARLKMVEPNLEPGAPRRDELDGGDLLANIEIVRDENGRPWARLKG